MSLWFKVRAITWIVGAVILTGVVVASPLAGLQAGPSPAGATIAVGCLAALLVPIVVAWGSSRGDGCLDAVSTRPIQAFDLLLAVWALAAATLVPLLLAAAGVASAGAVTARASLTYFGLLLLAQALVGWRTAAIVPIVYLLFALLVGRGEDSQHPAWWSWIAAVPGDATSWCISIALAATGVTFAALAALRHRLRLDATGTL